MRGRPWRRTGRLSPRARLPARTLRRRSKRQFRCRVSRRTTVAPALAELGPANFRQFSRQRDTKYIGPARDASLHALALAPGLASAHVTLGFLYAVTDQNDLAGHEIDEALRLDKFNAAAYGALAELQTRQGRTELVEGTLQKAVSLAPDDWMLNMKLGAHYVDSGKWAQAGNQFHHAIELVPDNPRAYNNLVLVDRGLGRLDDSAAAFQKSADLEPTFIHYRNLGMVLAEAGKYPEAERALGRSIEMRPNQYRAYGLLASVYANELADPAKVRETYLKAIALAADLLRKTPKDEYLLADVGGYYAAIGKEKESLPLLAQAAALAPDIPRCLPGRRRLRAAAPPRRRRCMACQGRAGGYPSEAITRNPQRRFRADPRHSQGDSVTNPTSIVRLHRRRRPERPRRNR